MLRLKPVVVENYDERRLRVEQITGTVGGRLFFGAPKSEASRRTVGLPDFVAFALQDPWHNAEPNQLLSRTSNDTPIHPCNLLRHFHQTLDKLDIPKVRFHSLRHTFLTLNTYGHLMPGYHEEAARKLDGLV